MLNDVRITVSDGQLASGAGAGIHVKIGASPVVSAEPISIKNTLAPKRIRERLGLSPLADACMDSLEHGAKLVYCIPVAPTIDGTVGEVVKTTEIASTGTMSITGKPNNRYDIAVKLMKGGGFNEAVLRYSFDGGVSYSDELTMPADGILAVQPTGLTLTFTEGIGDLPFAIGDLFTAQTTAPSLSNASVLAALAQVRKIKTTITNKIYYDISYSFLFKMDYIYINGKRIYMFSVNMHEEVKEMKKIGLSSFAVMLAVSISLSGTVVALDSDTVTPPRCNRRANQCI